MPCTADACQQGRKPCPVPTACEMPIQLLDEEPANLASIVIAVLSVALVMACAALACLLVGV